MGLSKSYKKLTDDPEFTSGLTITDGQGIKGSTGNKQLRIEDNNTVIQTPQGEFAMAASDSEGVYIQPGVTADMNPRFIRDGRGSFDAVNYISDGNAPATLELANADLGVDDGVDTKKDIFTGDYYDKRITTAKTLPAGGAIRLIEVSFRGWFVIVTGRDEISSGGPYFTDILVGARDSFTIIHQENNDGTLDRSYYFNNGDLDMSTTEGNDLSVSAEATAMNTQ